MNKMNEQRDDGAKRFTIQYLSSHSSAEGLALQVKPDEDNKGTFGCSQLPGRVEGDGRMLSMSLSNFSGTFQINRNSSGATGENNSENVTEIDNSISKEDFAEKDDDEEETSNQFQFQQENINASILNLFERGSSEFFFGRVSGQTKLHKLVSSSDLTLPKLERMLKQESDMAKRKDSHGRLPLHVLGNNSEMLQSIEGRATAKKCVLLLIKAYPDAIVHPDNNNHMPFIFFIDKWVALSVSSISFGEDENDEDKNEDKNENNDDSIGSWKRSEISQRPRGLNSDRESISDKYPPIVIFQQVEWSFEMLSLCIDYISDIRLDPKGGGRFLLSHKKQREKRHVLAQNLLSIPFVLESIMLLESNGIRLKLMDSPIIRQAMLCRGSVGSWLACMIRNKKGNSAERAIGYIETVPQLTVADLIGKYRMPMPKDQEIFKAAQLEVYDSVKEIVDFLPSLLVLDASLLDRAVSTPIVWYAMNQMVATPFTVALTVIDFTIQVSAMVAIRGLARETYENVVIPDGFRIVYVCAVVSAATYQFLRMSAELIVLSMISLKITRHYVLNIWNVINFIGFVASVIALFFVTRNGESGEMRYPFGAACVVGLLWLRLMGHFKNMNEQLAVFVVSLKEIIVAMRFILVVFLILIFAFGDMLHLLFKQDPSIDCNSDELALNAKDFCDDDISYAYLRVYAILVGDVEYSDYNDPRAVRFMWVTLTLFGSVVLLNVLIAVVTYSYDNSHRYSKILFRRSRVEFVVSHVTVERFLRNNFQKTEGSDFYTGMLFLRYFFSIGIYPATIVCLAVLVVDMRNLKWFLDNEHKMDAYSITMIASLASITGCCIWGMLVLLFESTTTKCHRLPSSKFTSKLKSIYYHCNDKITNIIAGVMFGIDTSQERGIEEVVNNTRENDNDELVSRMEKMETMLEQALRMLESKPQS